MRMELGKTGLPTLGLGLELPSLVQGEAPIVETLTTNCHAISASGQAAQNYQPLEGTHEEVTHVGNASMRHQHCLAFTVPALERFSICLGVRCIRLQVQLCESLCMHAIQLNVSGYLLCS
jgi:hypothetical protein